MIYILSKIDILHAFYRRWKYPWQSIILRLPTEPRNPTDKHLVEIVIGITLVQPWPTFLALYFLLIVPR